MDENSFTRAASEISMAVALLQKNNINIQLPDGVIKAIDPFVLFDGDDALFKSLAKDCSTYFEYGCGKSTNWMLENTDAKIQSVDSDLSWVQKVKLNLKANDTQRCQVNWVDIGKVGKWGYPLTFEKRENFIQYVTNLWKSLDNPEIVLIDGRFRVACFLASVMYSQPGTMIIFDDYMERELYKVAEEFLPIYETCGRQALFINSNEGKKLVSEELIEKFSFVFF